MIKADSTLRPYSLGDKPPVAPEDFLPQTTSSGTRRYGSEMPSKLFACCFKYRMSKSIEMPPAVS